MNQPCIDLRTTRCYITPQNHGFAVNANDGTNEGIIHRSRPWMSVQFHPEACGGPTDTSFLFDTFIQSVNTPGSNSITTIPYQVPITHFKVLVLGSGGLSIE